MVRFSDKAVLSMILLLAGTLFFVRLGAVGLFDADEPAYAQAAKEMLARGDWVTPTFNGTPRFDKPILFYWLILLSYRVFGITEFAVRCWSALAGIAVTGLLWLAARRWISREAALWTGTTFCTGLLAALLARAAVTDMLLTLFVTVAILAGVRALEEAPPRGRGWARGCWAAMALAVLVKGPIGLVIPGMALGGSLVILREVREGLRRLLPWEGPAVFLAITAPWYALVLAANGWAFIEGFVIKHHVTRYTGVISSHAGPLWFYLPVVLVGFFPWSGFLPAALWRAAIVARRRRAALPGDRLAVTCLCWVVGLFAFFSVAGTKLPSYLFPAFPAMALLVGGTIARTYPAAGDGSMRESVERAQSAKRRAQSAEGMAQSAEGKALRAERPEKGPERHAPCAMRPAPGAEEPGVPRWLSGLTPWLIGLTGGVLAVGFLLVPVLFDRLRPAARGVLDGVAAPTDLAWWLAGLLAAGTATALLAKGQRRPAFLALMMSGVILTAAWAAAPRAHAILQGALQEFSEDARRTIRPGDPVMLYGLNAPSIVFYSERRVYSMGPASPSETETALRGRIETGRPILVITRNGLASRLEQVPGLTLWKSRGGYALFGSRDTVPR
jgi:hypothetical protein